ncbi:f-box domain-containing protein [Gigaspora margarita]|uniref:F-box domain-containing protein n=1 Tax=Gigaspora margarita TaxID=4874 RepID=A0A8H4ATW2_GIGMA|nr:f-box domain-containing protein [Gigaspora margarita]
MIALPNECFLKIFSNFSNDGDYKSLFSCLFVNRHWCRIIIPILWRQPTVHFDDRRLIRMYLLELNSEEQASIVPFKIILPVDPKPLFEYTSFTTSVGFCLDDGVKNWLIDEGYRTDRFHDSDDDYDEPVNAIICSLIVMLLRTSNNLKHLRFNGSICNKMKH